MISVLQFCGKFLQITQWLSQNNVDHCENERKTPSISAVKYSLMQNVSRRIDRARAHLHMSNLSRVTVVSVKAVFRTPRKKAKDLFVLKRDESRRRPVVAILGKGVRCQWGQFGMRASPYAPPNIEDPSQNYLFCTLFRIANISFSINFSTASFFEIAASMLDASFKPLLPLDFDRFLKFGQYCTQVFHEYCTPFQRYRFYQTFVLRIRVSIIIDDN